MTGQQSTEIYERVAAATIKIAYKKKETSTTEWEVEQDW